MQEFFSLSAYIEMNIFCAVILVGISFQCIFFAKYNNQRLSPIVVLTGVFYVIYLIADAVYAALYYWGHLRGWSFYMLSSICLLSLLYLSGFWFLYVAREMGVSKLRKPKARFICLIPIFIVTLCVLINPFTGIIFSSGEDYSFQSGVLYVPYLVLVYLYLLSSSVLAFVKHRDIEDDKLGQCWVMAFAIVPIFTFAYIQIRTSIPTLRLGYTISIAIYFMQRTIYVFRAKHRSEMEQAAKEAELDRIVASLSPNMRFIFETNFETQQVRTLRSSSLNYSRFIDNNNLLYTDMVIEAAKTFVASDDIKNYIESMSCDYIRDYLQYEDTLFVKYRSSLNSDRCYRNIVKKKYPEDKDDSWYVVGIEEITHMVKQQTSRERTEAVLSALASNYDFIAYVRMEEDKLQDRISIFSMSADYEYLTQGLYSDDYYSHQLDAFNQNCVYEEDREAFYKMTRRDAISRALEENGAHFVNFRVFSDGRAIYYQLKFVPYQFEDGQDGFIVGAANIDDQTKAELQLRDELQQATNDAEMANQAKTEFLYSMSHDIRTPLNAIKGFNDLALVHASEPELVAEYMNKAKHSTDHLIGLVNEVLDIAKIESGNLELETRIVNPNEVFSEAIDQIRPMAEKKDVSLRFRTELDDDLLVSFDRLRTQQVVVNIVSNAVKYTNNGGHVNCILSQTYAKKAEHIGIKFVVDDDGVGMSDEFVATIFEKFSRAKKYQKDRVEGTGLGMPIVKQILEATGSKIKIESEEGIGTTVTIVCEWPIETSREAVSQNDEDASVEGMKVLVVDDNDLNREIVKAILHEMGVVVDEATNGVEAIELLKNEEVIDYQAILMDVEMPYMDGYEATRCIRQLDNPLRASIPVIATTANAFKKDRELAKEAGMDSFITKPIDINKLRSKLLLFK